MNYEQFLKYTVLEYTESDELSKILNTRIHTIHRIPTKEELGQKSLPSYLHISLPDESNKFPNLENSRPFY